MKTEERHELKTNELADWLAGLPAWFKENRGTVIYTAVIVILVLVSVYLKWLRPAPAVSAEQVQLARTVGMLDMAKLQVAAGAAKNQANPTDSFRSIADNLSTLSRQMGSSDSEALALIKQGEAIRAELHYGNLDEQARKFQLDKAQKAYDSAVAKAGNDMQVLALAKFGQGLTQEEGGNYEAAAKLYKEIGSDTRFDGTVVKHMANTRLGSMDDYKGNFVFVEAPKAEPNAPAGQTNIPAQPAEKTPQAAVPAPAAPKAAAPAPAAPPANNAAKPK